MKDKITAIFWIYSIYYVTLAIAGGIRQYSPVPHWDMLAGYLFFDSIIQDAPWTAWFMQHNEHRIFFSRLLFWIDIHVFQGKSWFLISMNYSLILLCYITFSKFLSSRTTKSFRYLHPFMLAWLFTWSQNENLTWGFQSQFFMAELFPLLSMYFLYKSSRLETHNRTSIYFYTSLLFAFAALGTMANGILALPIMAVCTLALVPKKEHKIAACIVASIGIYLYVHNYSRPETLGNPTESLTKNPIAAIKYILLYFGSPFYYINKEASAAKSLASFSGLVFFLLTAFIVIRTFTKPETNPSNRAYTITLIGFLLYVIGTATGTAGGRLIQGVDQALSSRYLTPCLMAWCSVLLLYIDLLKAIKPKKIRNKTWVPFASLLALLTPQQISALNIPTTEVFEKNVSALALELGIIDKKQINHIYPDHPVAIDLTRSSIENNTSIFGLSPLKDARSLINSTLADITNSNLCNGGIIETQDIEEDRNYKRILGIVTIPLGSPKPKTLQIIDDNHVAKGFAMVDYNNRYKLEASENGRINYWFKGYIKAEATGIRLSAYERKSKCLFTLTP